LPPLSSTLPCRPPISTLFPYTTLFRSNLKETTADVSRSRALPAATADPLTVVIQLAIPYLLVRSYNGKIHNAITPNTQDLAKVWCSDQRERENRWHPPPIPALWRRVPWHHVFRQSCFLRYDATCRVAACEGHRFPIEL